METNKSNVNSVLKGMNPRTPGSILPEKPYNANNSSQERNTENEKERNKNTQSARKTFKNQQHQVKVAESIKEELNALKVITKTKFDYEIIELLIDSFIRNELSAPQKRKFKAITMKDED